LKDFQFRIGKSVKELKKYFGSTSRGIFRKEDMNELGSTSRWILLENKRWMRPYVVFFF
jgi:hypothetical protein